MYGPSEKLDEYYKDKETQQKREQTKTELKQLLKKYIKEPAHNPICSDLVGNAQKEMGFMHDKMDKAVQKIGKYGEECNIFFKQINS